MNQNFTGDFTKHPDGNFPSVIRNSEGVVFTMFPWNEPIAPKRIWCVGLRLAGRCMPCSWVTGAADGYCHPGNKRSAVAVQSTVLPSWHVWGSSRLRYSI